MPRGARGRRHGHGNDVLEPLRTVIWSLPENEPSNPTSIEELTTFITPQELFAREDSAVTDFFKTSSLHKLGELEVKDQKVIAKLADKALMTMGTDDPTFDWKAGWQDSLGIDKYYHNEGWGSSITVEAWVLTVKNAIAPDHKGILYEILKNYNAGLVPLNMFGLPPIQAVLEFKWRTFAKTSVVVEVFFLVMWLLCFTILGVLMANNATTGLWAVAGHVCNILALVGSIPFLLIEVASIVDYGFSQWFGAWNLVDIGSCLLQIAFFVAHLTGDLDEPWVSSLIAVQNLLIWLRFFFTARAMWTSTKVSLVDMMSLVCIELRDFVVICTALLWAFAFSFRMLFRMDSVTPFKDMQLSLMNVLKWMKAGADMNLATQVKAHEMATIGLLVMFQLMMTMMMMTLLVGVVNRSVAKCGEHQELKASAAQSTIIIDLENMLPSWIENMFPKAWYPCYLHVLRIKPSSLTKVDDKLTWQSSRTAAAGTPATGGGGAAAAGNTALEKKLESLQKTLDSQTQLLHTLLMSKGAANGVNGA